MSSQGNRAGCVPSSGARAGYPPCWTVSGTREELLLQVCDPSNSVYLNFQCVLTWSCSIDSSLYCCYHINPSLNTFTVLLSFIKSAL